MTATPTPSADLPRATLGVLIIVVLIALTIWILRPFLGAVIWASMISIYALSILVLAITGLIFVVVFALIAYVIVRYRQRSDDDGREPAQV